MNNSSGTMPYIKSEPDDFGNNPNRFMRASQFQNYGNQFNSHQDGASIDPSELSMQNNYGMNYNFGATNMSSSFSMGNSGYDDSELLEGLDFGNAQGSMLDDFSNVPQQNNNNRNSGAIPMNQEVYSSTPDGHPIQSPFLGNFDYSQFRPMNSIPQHMSPMSGSQFAKRPSMQTANRKSSDQRSPLTPRTAAMAGLHIGTPEPANVVNGRPIRAPSVQNRHSHSKNLSGQYDSTPGSLQSYLDSPLSSPGSAIPHAGISETIGSGHHASLPAKVENGLSSNPSENAEAKKRRRRASHNAVERRRRDNINERIQDLSHLVPQHRLDDDKVKKQLQNTGPLSPTVGATSMSPPTAGNAAASILAGPGRRTAGNITIGLPLDEKEKGPNKGDILNGSVSWTRDLMWALYQKYQQDDELAQTITGLGGSWPFQITDEEKRMRSEVMDAMEKNDPSSFSYSRQDGSGLRVPRYTNLAGDRIQANSSLSPQSNFELSPGFHSGGSGTNSGSNTGQPQYWHSAGHGGISFKEEDEFMEMN